MEKQNNLELRIQKVKAKLILEQPYFGTIASGLKTQANDNIQAFITSPGVYEYNGEFIETLSDAQLAYTLTNCAMHHALIDDNRKTSKVPWLWTLAQDYSINSLLVKNGLKPPLVVNHDIRFDNLNAEIIYNILEDEIDDKKNEDMDEKVEHIKSNQEEKDTHEDDIKDINKQQIQKAKMYGDLPLGIDIAIPKIYDGQVNWTEELYEVIEQSMKFDYTLLPPNKRFLQYGIALPGLSGTKSKIIIAIDASGSIDDALLGVFLGEVNSIMNMFANYEIDLLITDAKVHEHIILYPGDEIPLNIKGGGGTSFEETFKYIYDNIFDVSLLLYFTDGEGKFPKDEVSYEVVWALSQKEITVPFGRTIYIKEKNKNENI